MGSPWVADRRRLAVDKEWTECTECDGRGYIKEWARGYMSNRECTKCNGTEAQWRPRCPPRSKKPCNGSIVKMEEKCPLGSFPKPAGSAPRWHSATSKKFKPINA